MQHRDGLRPSWESADTDKEFNPYGATGTLTELPSETRKVEAEVLSPLAIQELARTQPWVRFLGALSLLGCIFGILVAALLGKNADSTLDTWIGVIYAAFSILFLYPGLKLEQYSAKIKDLVRTSSMRDLEAALQEQRLFWRFYGMVMGVYLLILVGVVFFVALRLLSAIGKG